MSTAPEFGEQGDDLASSLMHLGQVSISLGELRFEQLDHALLRATLLRGTAHEASDIGQGESQLAGPVDELHDTQFRCIVAPIAICGSYRLRQQASGLVEAYLRRAHAGLPGKFSDLHDLDLQPDLKV